MKTILFIEDDPGEREVVARLYQMCIKTVFHGEVEFVTASTWEDGMDKMAKIHPDVVLADLTLPPQTADETIERIREIARTGPPIVVLTGHEERQEELRVKCVAGAGASDFILKRHANRHPEALCERIYMAYLRRQYGA